MKILLKKINNEHPIRFGSQVSYKGVSLHLILEAKKTKMISAGDKKFNVPDWENYKILTNNQQEIGKKIKVGGEYGFEMVAGFSREDMDRTMKHVSIDTKTGSVVFTPESGEIASFLGSAVEVNEVGQAFVLTNRKITEVSTTVTGFDPNIKVSPTAKKALKEVGLNPDDLHTIPLEVLKETKGISDAKYKEIEESRKAL